MSIREPCYFHAMAFSVGLMITVQWRSRWQCVAQQPMPVIGFLPATSPMMPCLKLLRFATG